MLSLLDPIVRVVRSGSDGNGAGVLALTRPQQVAVVEAVQAAESEFGAVDALSVNVATPEEPLGLLVSAARPERSGDTGVDVSTS